LPVKYIRPAVHILQLKYPKLYLGDINKLIDWLMCDEDGKVDSTKIPATPNTISHWNQPSELLCKAVLAWYLQVTDNSTHAAYLAWHFVRGTELLTPKEQNDILDWLFLHVTNSI